MKKQWRINQLLWTGFGVIFIIVIIIAVLTGMNTKKAHEGMNWVEHTYQVRLKVSAIKKLLLDAETGQRGYLFTGRESYLEPYINSIKVIDDQVMALKKMVNDNPAQVQRIENIHNLIKQKLAELHETIQLKRDDKNAEVLALVLSDLGKQLMDDLRVKFEEFQETEAELLAQRMLTVKNSEVFSNRVSIGGTIFTIFLGIFICLFASGRIMGPIKETASKISSATVEIASTVEQHERTASQQSTAVNETTTTMEELDKSSQQSSKQADSAAVVANEVLKLSQEGIDQMQLAQEATVNLKEKVSGIAEQILQLSEQTSQIQNITILVTDLANQTNLLALNAAVEAARAGEHGKGFAVVAAEIRKLADESKKSAGQIQTLVSDIQKATNSTVIATEEGTRRVEEVTHITRQNGTVLNTISDSAENAAESIQQISLNSRQQAAAISQVVNAMNSINNGAKETSNGIRQTKEGLRDIEVGATQLNAMV